MWQWKFGYHSFKLCQSWESQPGVFSHQHEPKNHQKHREFIALQTKTFLESSLKKRTWNFPSLRMCEKKRDKTHHQFWSSIKLFLARHTVFPFHECQMGTVTTWARAHQTNEQFWFWHDWRGTRSQSNQKRTECEKQREYDSRRWGGRNEIGWDGKCPDNEWSWTNDGKKNSE